MLIGAPNIQGTENTPNLTIVANLLGFGNPENFFSNFPILYLIVCILTILVYNLGFARKLPILKLVIVYIALFLGNFLITFLALTLPIVEALIVAVVVLGIYKVRLKMNKREETAVEK